MHKDPIMKILFFSDHFLPEMGPPAAHVYERSKIWVEQGHEVTVITNVPNAPLGVPYEGFKNKFRQIEYMSGIKVIRVGTYMAENKGTVKRIFDYISYTISALLNSLFMQKPDVVISTSPHLFVPLAGVVFSMIRRVPHVFEIRDLWPHSIAATTNISETGLIYKSLEILELFLYKRSTHIIAMTKSFVANLVSRGVPKNKITYVINGANLELFHPAPPNIALQKELHLEDKFVIGYIGTMGLPHNITNVIECAKLLINSNIVFLFVGEGAGKQAAIDLTNKYNLDNVIFIPRQNKEDVPLYWSVCNVGLIHLKNAPLFKTVIPSKIFETMAMGLPIIYVGPEGEGTSLVKQHSVGICIEPDNPTVFATEIRGFINNSNLNDTMKKNSSEASPLYSRKKHAEKTLDVLKLAANEAGIT